MKQDWAMRQRERDRQGKIERQREREKERERVRETLQSGGSAEQSRVEYSRVEKRGVKQASVEVYETGKHLDKEGETILNNVYE